MIGEFDHPDLLKNPDAIVLSKDNVTNKEWMKRTLLLPNYRYDMPVPIVLPNGTSHMIQSRAAICHLIDFAVAYYDEDRAKAEKAWNNAIRHEASAPVVLAFQKIIFGAIKR